MKEIHCTKKDFRIEWYSGSGAGGQHRNKHQNCCRIIHIESGLSAIGTSSRSRVTNQRDAFNKLALMVISYLSDEKGKERFNASERVRNYNECRNEVHDIGSGLKLSYKNVVLKNDIAEMIEARSKAFN